MGFNSLNQPVICINETSSAAGVCEHQLVYGHWTYRGEGVVYTHRDGF